MNVDKCAVLLMKNTVEIILCFYFREELKQTCPHQLPQTWATPLQMEAGAGLWCLDPSSPSGSLMPSPNPLPSSSKKSRSISPSPTVRLPGSPPSCWLPCMQEVRKHITQFCLIIYIYVHHFWKAATLLGILDTPTIRESNSMCARSITK